MKRSELRQIIREEVSKVLIEQLHPALKNVTRVTTVYVDGTNRIYAVELYDKSGRRIEKISGRNAPDEFKRKYNIEIDALDKHGIETDTDDMDVS